MYVTAQRVRARETGYEGINAFYYLHHGPVTAPEVNPGVLFRKLVSVEPPGNLVRSYLDVLADDGKAASVLRHVVMQLVGLKQRQPLPWQHSAFGVMVRFGADGRLAREWQGELAELFRAIEAVRLER